MRRAWTVLVALLVLASAVGSATATTGATGAGSDDTRRAAAGQASVGNETRPADEIYLRQNGDAVLVYEKETGVDRGRVGVHLGTGLVHLLVRNRVDSRRVVGDGSLVLSPDRIAGTGSLTAGRPTAVRDLSIDVTGKTDADRSTVDASLAATVTHERADRFAAATSNGSVTSAAGALRSTGRSTVTFARPIDRVDNRTVTLRETESGYMVEAREEFTVSGAGEQRWSTRESARSTLASRYRGIAASLNGSSNVTINSHAFRDEHPGSAGPVVEVAYRVTYTGVDEGVQDLAVQLLSGGEAYNLSETEVRSIAERATSVRLTRVHFDVRQWNTTARTEWSVEIDDHLEVAFAALDLAAAADLGEETTAEVERTRARLEAQRAANLAWTVSWSANATAVREESTMKVAAEVHADAENWSTYVDELENRSVDRGNVTVDFHAETTAEDTIETTAAVEVEQEALVSSAIDSLAGGGGRISVDPESRAAFRALQRADFRKARFDVSVRRRTVRFRAAAAFRNTSAFSRAMEESYGDVTMVSGYGRYENETLRSYVRVTGLVDNASSVSKDDVRATALADGDTAISLPGEWDREFPAMNTTYVSDYLDLAPGNGSASSDGGASESGGAAANASTTTPVPSPGFGVPLSLVALVAALLARRRYGGS